MPLTIQNHMNKKLRRPLLINLGIVLFLVLTDVLLNAEVSRFLVSGTFILLVAVVNFVIGMIRNRNRTGDGPYYFLIAGILLLIGLSVCSVALV